MARPWDSAENGALTNRLKLTVVHANPADVIDAKRALAGVQGLAKRSIHSDASKKSSTSRNSSK